MKNNYIMKNPYECTSSDQYQITWLSNLYLINLFSSCNSLTRLFNCLIELIIANVNSWGLKFNNSVSYSSSSFNFAVYVLTVSGKIYWISCAITPTL